MRKILLLSDLSREPDRQLIRGLTKYVIKIEKWQTYIVATSSRDDPTLINDIVEKAKYLEVDAIFGTWPAIEDRENNLGLNIPIVLKPKTKAITKFSTLNADSNEIGEMAASFFEKIGILNVTTSGFHRIYWSDRRVKAFKNHSNGHFFNGIQFSLLHVEYKKIANWLAKLPKPIGIFACNDVNASIIIEVCHSLRLRIPEDVAILGVDDDTFICNITSPSISSIRLDYEKAGFLLGKELVEHIKNKDNSIFNVIHKPIKIVERETTPASQIKDPFVRDIVRYMNANYLKQISIKDVIADIPLSIRSIEMRFKAEFPKMTMREYLIMLKIEHLKNILATSDATLLEAAISSGFSAEENIYRIFKKYAGCTPLEFKKMKLENALVDQEHD